MAEELSRKAAPRKLITRIEKTGSWGQVEWLHYLECGHIAARKRKAPAEVMACTDCVLALKHQNQVQTPRSEPIFDDDLVDQLGSQLAAREKSVAQLRADLASRLGVSDDAIRIEVDEDESNGAVGVSYAVVLLTADEIFRLTS